jgi:glucose/mannose-6-phosphate isomerase
MTSLDDPGLLALDREDMFGRIRELGTELIRAWDESEEMELPAGAEGANAVVVAGMGGSATAGDYFAVLCAPSAEIPVAVVRGFELPNWVNDRTLVVVSSYSGNTQEALACYDDGWRRGAMLLAITTGGQLAARADGDGVPMQRIRYVSRPRAALAHGFAPLLRLGHRLGHSALGGPAVEAAGQRHRDLVERELAPEVPAAGNRAKRLAEALDGRLALVLGGAHLAPAAGRFRNQLAENGKTLGLAESLPEAGHNLVVGLATAGRSGGALSLVTLEPADEEARLARTFAETRRLFETAGVPTHRVAVGGETPLEQLLEATAWGDYVSCYLALLHGEDPSPTPQIDALRAALGS